MPATFPPTEPFLPPEARARRAQLLRTLGLLLWLGLSWQLARGCLRPQRPRPAPQAPLWLRIDLGRDPAWRLSLLPGIGTRRAYDIVRDRRRGEPLRNLGELKRIRGIGPATVERLRRAPGLSLWLNGRPLEVLAPASPSPMSGQAQEKGALVR